MDLLLVTVFTASLLGSAHCAGMCGPLLPFYAAGAPVEKRWLGHLTYSIGRLVSYGALGAIAGFAGSAVNLAGEAAGVIRISAIAAGVLMILWGLGVLFARFGLRFLPRNPLGGSTAAVFRRIFGKLQDKPPLWRAAMLGLFSTLLPCGWLYAFVITAAGTGSPWQGGLVMLLFWTGTLPVMVSLGVGIQVLSGRFRRHLPVVGAVAIVVMGLISVIHRAGITAERFEGIKAPVVMQDGTPAVDKTPAKHPCCEKN